MNIDPGAWALIYCHKTGKFLLGKRSQLVHKPGLWNFFGGHLEPGESPRVAVLRELDEETGLSPDMAELQPLGTARFSELGYAAGLREFHYFVLFTERELKPKLGPEHSLSRWFAATAIPKNMNRPSSVAIEIGLTLKAQQLALQLGLR